MPLGSSVPCDVVYEADNVCPGQRLEEALFPRPDALLLALKPQVMAANTAQQSARSTNFSQLLPAAWAILLGRLARTVLVLPRLCPTTSSKPVPCATDDDPDPSLPILRVDFPTRLRSGIQALQMAADRHWISMLSHGAQSFVQGAREAPTSL